MGEIIYPKRVENRVHIPDFRYAEPENIFYVHDFFVLLFLYLNTYFFDEKEKSLRVLLCTVLELYGWRATPLSMALQNPKSSKEDIETARALRFKENGESEELKAINIYWSYHDALLQVPLAWFRPDILAGDVFCHEIFRFSERRHRKSRKGILPSLSDEIYIPFRKELIALGGSTFERCQDIERVFVEFYGSPSRESITVSEILNAAPEIKKDYLMDFGFNF